MAEFDIGITESPIGLIEIRATAGAIISLEFVELPGEDERRSPIVEEAIWQLSAYFDGTRRDVVTVTLVVLLNELEMQDTRAGAMHQLLRLRRPEIEGVAQVIRSLAYQRELLFKLQYRLD